MIYVGHYRQGLPNVDGCFPELTVMCEADIVEWGDQNWHRLDGMWTNRSWLLNSVPANSITVIRRDGSEFALTAHPSWQDGYPPMDFYINLSREELESA